MASESMDTAAQWLAAADAVLIVAGAGMSGYPAELKQNVYVVPGDFEHQYPETKEKFGIRTAYEAVGMMACPETVPETENWKFRVQHYGNQRFVWEPNSGYDALKKIVGTKDCFVLTSNVDGCFVRAGFDPERIYTPQGDTGYMQCWKPCKKESVWWGEEQLLSLRAKVLGGHAEDGKPKATPLNPCETITDLDAADCPKCPNCGGTVVLNVRAGGNYLHTPYVAEQERFVAWTGNVLSDNKRIVVLEIGAGMNTPTVTRFPAESIIKESGPLGAMIRLNPATDRQGEVPKGLERAIAFRDGWEKLAEISEAVAQVRESGSSPKWPSHPGEGANCHWEMCGHFDWKIFMRQLL